MESLFGQSGLLKKTRALITELENRDLNEEQIIAEFDQDRQIGIEPHYYMEKKIKKEEKKKSTFYSVR